MRLYRESHGKSTWKTGNNDSSLYWIEREGRTTGRNEGEALRADAVQQFLMIKGMSER